MTALVIGGTGDTGGRVVSRLRDRGVDVRIGSRRAEVPFEWADSSTYHQVLDGVDRAYVVPSRIEGALEQFVSLARDAGVKRLVLLGHTLWEPDQYPDCSALRPTWFMQNFVSAHPIGRGIAATGEIRTATGDGRLAFIHSDDIADVAVAALLSPEPLDTSVALTGPESFSYAEAATVLSEAAGREIRHVPLTEAQRRDDLMASGLPAALAERFAAMEVAIAAGPGEHVTDGVTRITARPPRSLRDFATENLATLRTP